MSTSNVDSFENKQAKDTRGQAARNQVTALWNWYWDLCEPYLGNRVLELGCGGAVLADRIAERAETYFGLDYDESVVKTNRSKFGDSTTINFVRVDLNSSDLQELLRERDIDTVLAFNVLEHLEDDEEVVSECYRGMKKGGKFVALSPAIPSLYGSSDRAAGHYRRYSRQSLLRLFESVGFKVVSVQYMNFFGLFPMALRHWILEAREGYFESSSSLKLKLHNLLIPCLEFLESVITPPLGTSIFGVFRKPTD